MASAYCIASLISVMKDAFANSQIFTGRTILEVVAKHPSVNVDVDDTMISRLVNQKAEVNSELKSGAAKKEVIAFARAQVETTIIPNINPILLDDTCTNILKQMHDDPTVSDTFCDKMQTLYANQQTVDFFTNAILYALCRTNLPTEETAQPDDFLLLKEADYHCPLCGNLLWKKNSKGKYQSKYRVVKIFPERLEAEQKAAFATIHPAPRSLDYEINKLALCRDCAEEYIDDPQIDAYTISIGGSISMRERHGLHQSDEDNSEK